MLDLYINCLYCNHVCVTLPASRRGKSTVPPHCALSACQEIWKRRREPGGGGGEGAVPREVRAPSLLPGDHREAEEVSNRRMHRSYQILPTPFAAAAASTRRVMLFICNITPRPPLRFSGLQLMMMKMVPLHRNSSSSALPAKKVLLTYSPPPLPCATLCMRSNRPTPTQLN